MMQAVILAGGKGTRLKDRLNGAPKPLIDICGLPLLERQILLCRRYGITHILILVNHAAEQIIDFCASRKNWGMAIECIDDGEPRGTAGAVLACFNRLQDEFLILYGDTMLDVDLRRFMETHRSHSSAAATLFLHPNDHPHDSDLVDMDETGRISAFYPYPHPEGRYFPNLVNAALYVMKKSALAPWKDRPGILDFGKNLFPEMLQKQQSLMGYNSPEYIKDCGTPERLDKVCADFLSGRIARSCLDQQQIAVFMDRDGTINKDGGYISSAAQFELIEGAGPAIKKLNKSDYRAVVVTNQPVLARGECTVDALHQIHNKMETLLGQERAYLDRIYYCPHHPESGFAGEVAELKRVCDCRKPEIGMINCAQKDLNIDLSRSWLIGDATVDVLAAKKAGLLSILVETGAAGMDRKHLVQPDFIAPNLGSAVEFILDEYPALKGWCDSWIEKFGPNSLVLIGGASRSGKTTIAHMLRHCLALKKRRCVVLSIDRWLLSEQDRGAGVMERYASNEIRLLIRQLAQRKEALELSLPVYDKINCLRIDNAETIRVEADDIVIIEGTIILALAENIPATAHTLYVETAENMRHSRFVREYKLRDYDEARIRILYESRQADEIPVIEASSLAAQHRLRLPLYVGPAGGNA